MCNGSQKGETQVNNNCKTRAFQTTPDRSILNGKMQWKKKRGKKKISSKQFNKDSAKLFSSTVVVILMPSSA